MSAAGAAAVVAELRHRGWLCFASLSSPVQVDRCFLHPDTSVGSTRGVVWLVHTTSRAAGGGPLRSAEVYGLGAGSDDGATAAGAAGTAFAAHLLGGQRAALFDLNGTATFDGIQVVRRSDFKITLTDYHVPAKDPAKPAFASTAAVKTNLGRALPSWKCTYASDFYCTGRVDGSPSLIIHTERTGTKAGYWTVGLNGHTGTREKDRQILAQEISAFSAAGILTARQTASLRAHLGHSLEADIDGKSIGVLDSEGPVLVLEAVSTSY